MYLNNVYTPMPMGLHVNWIVLYVYNNNFDCSKGFVYIGHKTSKAKYRLVLRTENISSIWVTSLTRELVPSNKPALAKLSS